MAVKKIRKIGDPVLREKSKDVDIIDQSILKLVEDMIDTVSDESVSGIGLAAPQIGILKRVIIVNLGDKFETFINPEIEILDDFKESESEGCLSIYSVKTEVKRPRKILLTAKDLKNKKVIIEAEGIAAEYFSMKWTILTGYCSSTIFHLRAGKIFIKNQQGFISVKILFLGSSEFSVPFLEKICSSKHEIAMVLTKPDMHQGRGKELLLPNPVKELSLKLGLNYVESAILMKMFMMLYQELILTI